MRKTLLLLLAISCSCAGLLRAQTGEVQSLTIYPSFQVKFMHEGKSYLLASTIVVNVSDRVIRDLALTQVYPPDLVPEAAPEGVLEYLARPEGTTSSIEGQTFKMHTPMLRRGEVTSAVALLRYDGRPSTASIPPAEITYTSSGQAATESGPALTLDLKKYTKYSGDLSDFIKRYAGIVLTFSSTEGPDWGFSAFASRVKGKTPLGLVEIEGDPEEGRFSLTRGAPGETRMILMTWRPADDSRPVQSEAAVQEILKRQISSGSDFVMDNESARIEKGKLGRNEAWVVTSRWKDRIQDRLGEGPIKWFVYEDRTRSRQYIMMIAAQGRGAGPEKAVVPNEAQEKALMEELEAIAGSFRPV